MWLWVPKQSALDPLLLESFRVDPELGGPVLEIAVSRCEDLFNTLDRSPFRRRDLSPDLKAYLLESSLWVPVQHPVAFEIQLEEPVDEAKQKEVTSGLRAYFAFLIGIAGTEARQQRQRIAGFVLLSFCLMSAAVLLGPRVDREHPVAAYLLSGFTVGGWVFLWEALSVLFIRSHERNLQLARYRRLVEAPIRFVAAQAPSASP